ncbi:hypothetical protein FQA39_LY04744 [Lamprigera yunnana]|nr:hypothetical protein FQA39_LY04744 [Lamprigera yunnana]
MSLSRQLWEAGIPLLEHTVIEAHPDNESPDLRLDQPWPALRMHLDNIDVSNLGTKERSHTPALTILYYYLQRCREKHHGLLPKTS